MTRTIKMVESRSRKFHAHTISDRSFPAFLRSNLSSSFQVKKDSLRISSTKERVVVFKNTCKRTLTSSGLWGDCAVAKTAVQAWIPDLSVLPPMGKGQAWPCMLVPSGLQRRGEQGRMIPEEHRPVSLGNKLQVQWKTLSRGIKEKNDRGRCLPLASAFTHMDTCTYLHTDMKKKGMNKWAKK